MQQLGMDVEDSIVIAPQFQRQRPPQVVVVTLFQWWMPQKVGTSCKSQFHHHLPCSCQHGAMQSYQGMDRKIISVQDICFYLYPDVKKYLSTKQDLSAVFLFSFFLSVAPQERAHHNGGWLPEKKKRDRKAV